MASIGHVAIGMAAARIDQGGRPPTWVSMAWWSAVSLLPDVDVVGFSMGVEYGDPWGHRGATHSLVFAVAVGVAIDLAARWFTRPALRTGLLATAVLASHGLLDTMTDGGLGCALFWPFDLTRYFAPWQPIPVAPIGLAFFSPIGAVIALTEVILFLPAWVFALRPAHAAARRLGAIAPIGAVWIAGVWLVGSSDPVRETIVGAVLREDTAYAAGFSETAFRGIRPGASDEEVRRQMGAPYGETWFYSAGGDPSEMSAASLADRCFAVRFAAGVVVSAVEPRVCGNLGVREGMRVGDVTRLLGPTPESCWHYTWSPGNRRYRARTLCFMDGAVETIVRRWQ